MKSYIPSVIKQFKYYKLLGEKAIDQLSETDLHWTINNDDNSIAILVKHMVGNMHSRFTNFLTEDGEKSWRQRDAEFMDSYADKGEMMTAWNIGWQCLFDAVEPLDSEDLERTVYIRNEGHTVIEALNRQLMHYAYHIGQIVLIAKMRYGDEWKSLSIPKGESDSFNAQKFDKEKGRRHFTEDL